MEIFFQFLIIYKIAFLQRCLFAAVENNLIHKILSILGVESMLRLEVVSLYGSTLKSIVIIERQIFL
jgi:hypothetical protein